MNLLNNAADAIKHAEREHGLISVQTFVEHDCICLSILDNGSGIDPAIKDQLFNTHLTTKDSGHGFGLVTCGKIIENHNGAVAIDSTPSIGSTFTIRFPRNVTEFAAERASETSSDS